MVAASTSAARVRSRLRSRRLATPSQYRSHGRSTSVANLHFMQTPTLLISGAGIAGSTLAVLASRAGFAVTVVERAAGERSSGSPVDVHGRAYAVAESL